METYQSLHDLNKAVIQCCRCPRLVAYRESVSPKKAFEGQPYWKKPCAGFGDPQAWLLLIGLAPAAHGGNRTGRIFTGDGSGRFLFSALHEAGFANQPTSEGLHDGLKLHGCYITAAVKCAPPANKPTQSEFDHCSSYFRGELHLLPRLTHVLALGRLAAETYLDFANAKAPFKHGARFGVAGLPTLFMSYHPSPQNTNTGLLTHSMFVEVLETIKAHKQSLPGG